MKRYNSMVNWDDDIALIKDFFTGRVFPKGDIILDHHIKIVDIHKFLTNHMQVVKARNGNKTYKEYLKRLLKLKDHIHGIESNNKG